MAAGHHYSMGRTTVLRSFAICALDLLLAAPSVHVGLATQRSHTSYTCLAFLHVANLRRKYPFARSFFSHVRALGSGGMESTSTSREDVI